MINLRTNVAKRREAAAQVRIAAAVERSLSSYLKAEFKRVAKAAGAALVAHKNPTGDMVMESHRQAIKHALQASWKLAITANAKRVFAAAGKSGARVLETKATEDEIGIIVRNYSDEFTAVKVRQVSDTTKVQIINEVQSGLADGDSLDDIAGAIVESAGVIGVARAAVIARTETHAASQAGNVAAADSLRIPGLQKVWVAVEDERTRPDHTEADGQVVGMDEAFTVGQDQLDFPGDPSGSPEQTINCRCATVFQSPEE